MKLCGTVLPILVNEVTPDKPLSPGPRGRSGPNRVRPAEGHGAPLCGAGHRVIWREHFAQGLRGLRVGRRCGTPWGLRVGRRPRPWISCCQAPGLMESFLLGIHRLIYELRSSWHRAEMV